MMQAEPSWISTTQPLEKTWGTSAVRLLAHSGVLLTVVRVSHSLSLSVSQLRLAFLCLSMLGMAAFGTQ